MTLKMKTKTVHQVDYSDLETFVNEHFGFTPIEHSYKEWPYSFVAVQECGNDTSHEFHVIGELSEWDAEEFNEWRLSNGTGWVSNHTILDALCRDGVIPAGDYVVSVWW